jgi:hypothetical protein
MTRERRRPLHVASLLSLLPSCAHIIPCGYNLSAYLLTYSHLSPRSYNINILTTASTAACSGSCTSRRAWCREGIPLVDGRVCGVGTCRGGRGTLDDSPWIRSPSASLPARPVSEMLPSTLDQRERELATESTSHASEAAMAWQEFLLSLANINPPRAAAWSSHPQSCPLTGSP